MGDVPEAVQTFFTNSKLRRRPVHHVTWEESVSFISKLNSQSNNEFRLPTEAEWEYAARGGKLSKGYIYSGSDEVKEVAWIENSFLNAPAHVHEVGLKKPNELGIYDMSGNVLEWCSDWYDSKYYQKTENINPKGPTSGFQRICRGGSLVNSPIELRVCSRARCAPDVRSYIGIRLVCSTLK